MKINSLVKKLFLFTGHMYHYTNATSRNATIYLYHRGILQLTATGDNGKTVILPSTVYNALKNAKYITLMHANLTENIYLAGAGRLRQTHRIKRSFSNKLCKTLSTLPLHSYLLIVRTRWSNSQLGQAILETKARHLAGQIINRQGHFLG